MITAAQRELLDALYGYDATQETSDPEDGPIGEEGSEIGTIVENTLIPLQQTVLYLSKAITEDCQTFLLSLDRLYAHCQATNQAAAMELIQALKRLNDVCFNHNMQDRRADGNDYGALPTLQQLFGRLTDQQGLADRKAEISLEDAAEFQGMTVAAVTQAIARLQKKEPTQNTDWRAMVCLPEAQMPRPILTASAVGVRRRARRAATVRRATSPIQHQRVPRPRMVDRVGDRVPAHYSDHILCSPLISDIVYRKDTGLAYRILHAELAPRAEIVAYPDGLPIEPTILADASDQEGTYLVLQPQVLGARLTTLPDYFQHADLQAQAQ